MSLADLYNNQAIQNPSVQKTPLQMAYENLLNAQLNAQNTNSDEWGSAIGNSVNGLAKIISSAVIKDPYQKAGATNSLTMSDDRQDRLIKEWLDRRMNKKNNFVQQAKEQLGLANAEEEKDYQRGLQKTQAEISAQQYADKLEQIKQDQILKKAQQDEIARHNKAMEDIARANMDTSSKSDNMTPEEKITTETNTKTKLQLQNELNKIVANKDAFEEKMKGIDSLANEQGSLLGNMWELAKNPLSNGKVSNSQNVKAQLIQATLDAFGVDDKDRGDAKKVAQIVAQVGIGEGRLSKKDIKDIKDNIRRIYETRINQKNNELNRLLNPTQLGIANENTGGL